jgi:hypothetical protein
MTDFNQGNKQNIQGDGDHARQLLELELHKIRSQASAARLDAKAAEIEIVIERLKDARSSDEVATHELEGQRLRVDAQQSNPMMNQTGLNESPSNNGSPSNNESPSNLVFDQNRALSGEVDGTSSRLHHRFTSWKELRSAQIAADGVRDVVADQDHAPRSASDAILRFDAPHKCASSHHLPIDHREAVDHRETESEFKKCNDSELIDNNVIDEVFALSPADVPQVDSDGLSSSFPLVTEDEPKPSLDRDAIVFSGQINETLGSDQTPPTKRRGKSAAMLVSGVVHVAATLLMGGVALQIQEPKDQVVLNASAPAGEEAAMESFSIKTLDEPTPEAEITEPTPAEPEFDVSPIGEFKAADFSTDVIAKPISSIASVMTSQSEPTNAAMMLKPDSISKMKFCGVEGGGSHFVYLVDSSGSMGDAFESARRALFQSIDLLTPDQRFYVVFFDSKPDFMRISNPDVDEPRSVYATDKNKSALRRWAMRITMDRGKAPYDPLKFALGLRADVIFLLSDGEFPEGIPKLLQEENRVDNLFGDTKPISIVHTIGYFSKEGESIMTRIAKQNHGQYRHVPKP